MVVTQRRAGGGKRRVAALLFSRKTGLEEKPIFVISRKVDLLSSQPLTTPTLVIALPLSSRAKPRDLQSFPDPLVSPGNVFRPGDRRVTELCPGGAVFAAPARTPLHSTRKARGCQRKPKPTAVETAKHPPHRTVPSPKHPDRRWSLGSPVHPHHSGLIPCGPRRGSASICSSVTGRSYSTAIEKVCPWNTGT